MKYRIGIFMMLMLGFALHGCIPLESGGSNVLSRKGKYHIQTSTSMQVSALSKGDRNLAVRESIVRRLETFYIDSLGGNRLHIRSHDGSYVGLDPESGRLIATSEELSNAATFYVSNGLSEWSDLRIENVGVVCLDSEGFLGILCDDKSKALTFRIRDKPANRIGELPFTYVSWLYAGLAMLAIGLLSFRENRSKVLPLLLLFAGAWCLRYFVGMLPPYLHLWDEQFHALVARNMMSQPFVPMLYPEAIIPFPMEIWDKGSIWLHKQPLFLWQMALSFKFFGVNTFAMRLPSMLMSSAACIFIYRMGALSINARAGYLAGLLFACSYFVTELTAGQFSTEHNDVAFLFYVSASIWCWMEYSHSHGKRRWLFLIGIGIFTGGAMLVKWLTGILVFSGWGLSVLFSKSERKNFHHYRDMVLALGIALLLFLPWQIYTLQAFPELSRFEMGYNSVHFWDAVERHSGDFWFHFDTSTLLYNLPFWVILACVIIMSVRINTFRHKVALPTYIVIVYLFFSLASTKMIAFTFVIAPLIFLAFGASLELMINLLERKIHKKQLLLTGRVAFGLLVAFIALHQLNLDGIRHNHLSWIGDEGAYHSIRQNNVEVIKKLDKTLPEDVKTIVFNCFDHDHIPTMFFSKAYASYCLIPDEDFIQELKRRGFHLVFFDGGELPGYVLDDPDIEVVHGYQRW